MTDQITARAKYVDHGVTIPRGDVQIVLLDAAPVAADVKRALDQIAALFDTPRTEDET